MKPLEPKDRRVRVLRVLVSLWVVAFWLPLCGSNLRGSEIVRPPNVIYVANEVATGTIPGGLVKLTGAPSKGIVMTAGDTFGAIGICTSGCGVAAVSATASIANWGNATCAFDGATTAGHYVGISAMTGGMCTGAGAVYPANRQVLGRVLSTNGGAGVYPVVLFGPETQGPTVHNIRLYGAVCDGTDQNMAVQAAITAGAKTIYIPPGCVWIAPAGLIPGNANGITYQGGDATSIIKSAANPATAALTAGQGVRLINLNLQGNACINYPSCYVHLYINNDTITQPISIMGPVGYVYQGRTGVDENAISVTTRGIGGAIFAANEAGSGGQGFHAWQQDVGGSGMLIDRLNTGQGLTVSDLTALAATGNMVSLQSNRKTGGNMLQFTHLTSAFSGNTIDMNLNAGGAGAFTGDFLHLANAGVVRYSVNSVGDSYQAGKLEASSVQINDSGSKPTCDATTRGTIWWDDGAGGTADTGEICDKDKNDVYGWRSLVWPYRVAELSLTAQNAAITTTNLLAAAPAGTYRVSAYLQTTTASAGACTSALTIGWTYNASAKTATPVTGHSHAVDETFSQGTYTVRSQAAANITYAVDLTGGANCNNAVYDLYAGLERLQ